MLSLMIKLLALIYFYTPKIFKIVNLNEKNKFYRSLIIRHTLFLLQKILLSLNYTLNITINKDMIIVEVDGVLLINPGVMNRYYKIPSNAKYHNEAKILEKLLQFFTLENLQEYIKALLK